MRLAWYAGVSTALAATVVVSAFHQRANFYSAMVYLAQSNICLLVLVNFVYLLYGIFVYGLQRILYGPLRPIEVEQLSEKAWFAITETCLAMTIFREEIGAWFLVMFTALVTGKVWGWIGDGRVEVLEQQPPTNPGLFHTRLSVSLLLSLLYDVWLLRYTVHTVINQARPTMMVMFLFEFAVLATCSWRTGARYALSLVEARITKQQTSQRLEERRRQVGEERDTIIRQRELAAAEGTAEPDNAPLPDPEEVDEMDIEVPGWEAKGQWVLSLDLFADFVKLAIYSAFFFILLTFYGLPIHIMRDLFMTARSFIKRLTALLRYRRAIQDMARYADATEEDLAREDTCIICREDMRPWDPVNNPGAVERSRPKKLPCGHILHYGCLKSWLERQQVCPTCRRPVVADNAAAGGPNRDAAFARMVFGNPPPAAPQAQQPPQPNGAAVAPPPADQAPRNGGVRMFNLGPLRLGFAQGHDLQELAQRLAPPPEARNAATTPGTSVQQPQAGSGVPVIRSHLDDAYMLIQQELHSLQTRMAALQSTQMEMHTMQLLNAELTRIRSMHMAQDLAQAAGQPGGASTPMPAPAASSQQQQQPPAAPPLFPQLSQIPPLYPGIPPRISTPSVTRHVANGQTAIPAGSPELPEGVILPPGWSLLPLQRFEGNQAQSQSAPLGQGSDVPHPAQPTPVRPNMANSTRLSSSDTGTLPRMAVPSADTGVPSRLQEPAATSPAAGDDSASHAAVTPTSLPNWGGSAQMYGPESSFNRAPRTASAEPSNRTTVAPAAFAEAGSSGIDRSSPFGAGDDEQRDGADPSAKGKAKAATVEEAGEDGE